MRVTSYQLSRFFKDPSIYTNTLVPDFSAERSPLAKAILSTALGKSNTAAFYDLAISLDSSLSGEESKEELVHSFLKTSKLNQYFSKKKICSYSINPGKLIEIPIDSNTIVSSISDFLLSKEDRHELWISSTTLGKISNYPLLPEIEATLLDNVLRKTYRGNYVIVFYQLSNNCSLSISKRKPELLSGDKLLALLNMYRVFTERSNV